MQNMLGLIFSPVNAFGFLGYLIFFLGMAIEGEIFLFTGFFLMKQGIFDPIPMTANLFLGALAGDYLWLTAGHFLKNKTWKILLSLEKIAEPFDQHLLANPTRTIFIAKFAYGVYHPILLRAGILNMPKFLVLKKDTVVTIFWMAIIGVVAYLSGSAFGELRNYLKIGGYLSIIFLVLFLAVYHLFATLIKSEI